MSKNGLPRRPSDRELVEEFELSGVECLDTFDAFNVAIKNLEKAQALVSQAQADFQDAGENRTRLARILDGGEYVKRKPVAHTQRVEMKLLDSPIENNEGE